MRIQPSRDDLLSLTPEWDGERFDDGRPKVSDEVLDQLREATTEQIWSVLWDEGYERQFEGGWLETHPGRTVVGRAVTAQFIPQRPDFDTVVVRTANGEGRPTKSDNQNWMVVESLTENDVMVVDIFGKIYEGTVVGDNLGAAVAGRTKAGAVIHGGIRDLQGIQKLDGINIFHRGVDPTPIRNVTLAGLNIPVRIGEASVLPGDIVLATPSGVIFIPPQLAARAAAASVETRSRDDFGKQRLSERVYTSSQIDVPVWAADVEADYLDWLASSPSDQPLGRTK